MIQIEHIGKGEIKRLGEILLIHKPNKIFLVTGKSSYESSGAQKAIEPIVKSYGFVRFSNFEVNPKLTDIERGIEEFRRDNCDFVVAVGGGSVMDVAKAVNVFAANNGKLMDYIEKRESLKEKGKTLIAIPTTSGSGTQATHFAVIYVDKTKYSLADKEKMLPDYAIIDPDLTMSLPKDVTATTGMDALCQGIESFWCVNSTDESKRYAREAIKLAIENLLNVVNRPSEESRGAMAKAAHLAGKAINISQTTASHAISYPITSHFGLQHGHAVGLTIPQMILYNHKVTEEDCLDERGVKYVRDRIMHELIDLIGGKTIEEASEKITNLMREIGLNIKLSELKIQTQEDIDIIVKNGFNPDRVKNNPRKLTEEALRKILENIK
tara:strand:+ start:37066 stop:38211 length:1146 start_codon:yes stop_codon:yes gene_type:complete